MNDWSQWEKEHADEFVEKAKTQWQKWQQEKFPEMFDRKNYISGRACEHYHKFEEDFDIAKTGGHNAHRFSIEWSRIEPEEGKFNEKEIEHYRKVIKVLKEKGLEPFVTLWHWTIPLWVKEKGGIAGKFFPYYFSRYTEKIVSAFGNEVKFWITLNEPTSVIVAGYHQGTWPPGKKNPLLANFVYKNLARAHKEAYKAIHKLYPNSQVGFANILQSFEPRKKKNILDNLTIKAGKFFSNEKMLNLTANFNDYLAVQYYFRIRLTFPQKVHLGDKPLSDLNWGIYPQGIYNILKDLKKYNKPIYITENGLADADDSKRIKFIKDHLSWINKAMDEGVDVRGYFYWSLMDNFEWDKGFWPRFGLVEIDYKTFERKPRPSYYWYRDFINFQNAE